MSGPIAPSAHAQALQPVVDVCTGIRLPRSAVTQIVGAINQPIVDQIETTVNGLTTVTLVLSPLAVIPDLNIDLSSMLANAAAGAPISLQILDTNGNVITASDSCNLTADGYTLDNPAGISIGGNRISGLGADGQVARAGTLDSIAFGNNATTAPGAGGAIAIGTNAAATAPGSIALGTGSVADRGPLTGYTAPGLPGTFNSAGSLSVGAPGALRQITNVAPGTAPSDAATVGQVTGAVAAANADDVRYNDPSHTRVTLTGAGGTRIDNVAPGTLNTLSTDAVNGSQLFATNQQLAANTAATAANAAGVAALQANAVLYDNPAQTSVTLGGAGGTTIRNVAAGAVTATSNEAVNGSQLFATNQQLAANTANITALDARTSTNASSITNLDARVTTNTANITNLQQRVANVPVRYVSDADRTTPSATPTNTAALVAASGGPAALTNVAPATLSAASTDAVNGSQLYATNQQVAANTTAITVLSTTLQGAPRAPVQYSNPATPTTANGGTPTNDVTLVGANSAAPVAVHNVASGTLANDAVNLGQVQSGLAQNLTAARNYTDQQIAGLSFDLGALDERVVRLREDAFSGTASAMALFGIPQAIDQGRIMVGGGVGHYRSETSFALGISGVFGDGRGVVKAAGTMDSHGNGGF